MLSYSLLLVAINRNRRSGKLEEIFLARSLLGRHSPLGEHKHRRLLLRKARVEGKYHEKGEKASYHKSYKTTKNHNGLEPGRKVENAGRKGVRICGRPVAEKRLRQRQSTEIFYKEIRMLYFWAGGCLASALEIEKSTPILEQHRGCLFSNS